MSKNKIAKTYFPVLDIIKNRWSARSFNEQVVVEDDLKTMVEAASWMFSAVNEQPWRYIIAPKGSENFNKILSTLAGGNTPWAQHAGAFIVSIAKTTFKREGNPPNGTAMHDVGAANAGLILQATSMGIMAHPMGGFSKEDIKSIFNLETDLEPVIVIALGYLDQPEKLPEPFLTREITPRTRKPLEEILIA
ncbi:MAG: nitroreductase family protein [Bacteroidia bacterium]|nr:nitroreductase family protein [Bacteroidia bacterium]MCF8426685.1 nitroreductase family protein [Bacteroidia bacterium]MCF8447814.1 nitroreductase family protein [Bacteroidia bacterium]